METTLCRGKRIDNSKWVYGYYFNDDFYKKSYITVGNYCMPLSPDSPNKKLLTVFEVSAKTVEHFTGLIDKNIKNIIEGDIVRFGQNIYQVVFVYGSFCLYDKCGKMISKIGGINDYYYSLFDLHLRCCWKNNWARDIEVLGNTHDNPEILEDIK